MRIAVLVALFLCACRLGFDGSSNNLAGDSGTSGSGDDAAVPPPPIITPPATCHDNVKNADETGVDCGGLCERCDACTSATIPGSSCFCSVEWLAPGGSPVGFAAAYASAPDAALLAGQGGHVLWWDGTRFTRGYVGSGTLYAASGTGPDDIWLGGSELWHWDGTQWTKQMLPGGSVTLYSIHARAPDDVWAVSGNGTVHHYDGAAWTTAMPYASGTYLTAVFAIGPGDVLIAGLDGSIDRWNGVSLSPVPTGGLTFTSVTALAGVSPTEVYMLATPSPGSATIYRWNGSTFTDLAPGLIALESIAADGAGGVWALTNNALSHYTGSGWTTAMMPPGYTGSTTLSTAGRQELAFAGGSLFVADDGKRLAFDGVTWVSAGITAEDITGVWGSGSQFHALTNSSWLHDAGGQLVRDASPTAGITSTWGVAANDVWAIGNGNSAFHFDGTAWTNRGTANGIAAGSSTTDVWGVTKTTAGIARHWTGAAFSDAPLPANFTAEDAWAVSPTEAYAAGRHGTTGAPLLAKWNGTSWALITPPPATAYLNSVWASSATDVWVTAISLASANVWHLDGSGWTDVSNAVAGTAFASKIRGGGAGLFINAQGRVLKWNGSTWVAVTGGTGSCPSTPSATMWVSATDLWIGGTYGMLGRYTP